MNVMIENYSTLLVHTVEVLSGGIISHNVMFNQTIICKYCMHDMK